MFTHVMVGSSDLERSRKFYDATLGTLGHGKAQSPEGAERFFYRSDTAGFGVGKPANGAPPSAANGGTIGFVAKDEDAVKAWHAAGLANGGTDEGAPGPRMDGAMYGAYLRDPDGNKICAFMRPA
jgi:catechol 2,3-dioxygenase-like lactoylglutathione lyase family enzyme